MRGRARERVRKPFALDPLPGTASDCKVPSAPCTIRSGRRGNLLRLAQQGEHVEGVLGVG